MPITLLRGMTGASSRTSASRCSRSVSCTPEYSGSPTSSTTAASGSSSPCSSRSPVTTLKTGSSPVVNLAMRTARAYRCGGDRLAAYPEPVETTYAFRVLPADEWRMLRERHEERVDGWLAPHLARRGAGVAHPVEDFLFTYYSFRPAALRRWHPGFGTALLDADDHIGLKGYGEVAGGVGVTVDHVAGRDGVLRSTRDLLRATASRPPTFGCFGLHEWAMVHRSEVTRHPVPLRLGASGTDAVVESHRIACSHFDAYRFFAPSARPLNRLRPDRHDR